jgi:integrative and conjugative element protein (TIGR02256 family)
VRSALIWQSPFPAEGRVLVEAEPLMLMDAHRQNDARKPESGGILLGFRRGAHIHITMATPPQLADSRSRYLFQRSSRYHQEIALRQWNISKEEVDYVGEWHTHPQQLPSPSTTDITEWRKLSARLQMPMVFLIMGWSGEIWLGLSKAHEVKKCSRVGDAPFEA